MIDAKQMPDKKDASVHLCILTPNTDKNLALRVVVQYETSKIISIGPLKLESKEYGDRVTHGLAYADVPLCSQGLCVCCAFICVLAFTL